MAKPIIVVKICYKLLYVIQVVKKIFDKYRILQIVRGGKVSRMDKVLQICWKTFAVCSPWSKCAHVRR